MLEKIIQRLIDEAELSPAQAEMAAEIMLDAIESGALEIRQDVEQMTGGLGDLFGYGDEDWEDVRPAG
jgi:hypothetical protein